MIILCVDGLDPDLVQEYGWGKVFKHNYSLKIPQECYVPDSEVGSTPDTTRVWATIFTGKIIDYGKIRRKGIRSILHDLLVRSNITWTRRKSSYTIGPWNKHLNNVFDDFHSFIWNIPTISPEWIATFPSYEAFVEYCKRELWMWIQMSHGGRYTPFPLKAYYVRYVDYIGHNAKRKELKTAIDQVFLHVHDLKKREDVIVLSDHGCIDGIHTELAYFGSDHPILAESIHELRHEFERIFDAEGIERT